MDAASAISDPLFQSGAVGLLGVIVAALGFRRTGIAAIAVAAAWLWLCATPYGATGLWRGLADGCPPRSVAGYGAAAAIVVVGGGPVPAPLRGWDARTDPALATPLGIAVSLYRRHRAPVIVAIANYAMPEFVRAFIRQGIPASALRLEAHSTSTRGDAFATAAALGASRSGRILLVATRTHMPRALATFRRAGFAVTPVPTHAPAPRFPESSPLRPARAALDLSRRCLHEYIGIAYYRLRGWAAW